MWNYTASQALGSGIDNYYGSSLMLQSMIVMSGNFWSPTGTVSTPTPTPTPTATPTPTPTSTPTATPTPTPTPTSTASGLSVTFRYDTKWNDGWCGTLLVKNNTSANVSKYQTGFDLPTKVGLSSKWNGSFSRSGKRFTVLSLSWQSISAGETNSSTGFCVDNLKSSVLKTAVPTNLSAAIR